MSITNHVLVPMLPALAAMWGHLRVYRFSFYKAAGDMLFRIIFSSDFLSFWFLVSFLNKVQANGPFNVLNQCDDTMFSGFFPFYLCSRSGTWSEKTIFQGYSWSLLACPHWLYSVKTSLRTVLLPLNILSLC